MQQTGFASGDRRFADSALGGSGISNSRSRGDGAALVSTGCLGAGLIFCSGMVAINPETGEREHGTVTSEPRRIFEDLKLLLESAGSSLDRIVQVHAMIYTRTGLAEFWDRR